MSNIFDLTAARFSALTALSLAQLSDLAYRGSAEILAVLNEGGMQMAWFEDVATDTQAFVAWDDKVTVLVFRGTEGVIDGGIDAQVKMVPYLDDAGLSLNQVHAGFYSAWNSVSRDIEAHIAENCPSGEILVTGHSLGGALAVIAAERLVGAGRKVRLYTFGQPRVFDAPGVEWMSGRLAGYHRFVNNNDIVPRIPLEKWGYAHAGRLNHFDHQGNLLLDPKGWILLMDRVIGRIKDFGKLGTDGVKDHSMTGYVKLVEAHVKSLGDS